jgi:Family of unknown function (DUF6338)
VEFTLQGFLIAALGILPGFVPSFIKTLLSNESEELETERWIATSIIASMVLNAIVATSFLVWLLPIPLSTDISKFIDELQKLPVKVLFLYGGSLYVAAALWGLVRALTPKLRIGALAYRWRLTPISPVQNVFCATLDVMFRTEENLRLHGRPEQIVPWVRLTRNGTTIIGRLRRSSVKFDGDKPIEAFLSPAYTSNTTEAAVIEPPDGLYLRIEASEAVAMLSMPAGARPEF